MEDEYKINLDRNLVIWIIVSIIIAIIFARNSNGLCEYLFLGLSYIFLVYIITTVWKKFEINPLNQAIVTSAALGGWLIGTFIIWKSLGKNKFFSDN